jgi:hypothetical protein
MHIKYAIAYRCLAPSCAKAMITHMGFHATLSTAPPVSRAARFVNPKRAYSLVPVYDGRALERGWTGRGGRSRAAGAGPNRARRGETRRAEADPRRPSGPAGAAFGRPVRHPPGPPRPGAGRPGRPVPGRPPSGAPGSGAIGRRDLRLAWTGLCAPVRWRGRDCARFTGRLKITAQRAAGYRGRPLAVVPGGSWPWYRATAGDRRPWYRAAAGGRRPRSVPSGPPAGHGRARPLPGAGDSPIGPGTGAGCRAGRPGRLALGSCSPDPPPRPRMLSGPMRRRRWASALPFCKLIICGQRVLAVKCKCSAQFFITALRE